MLLPGGVVLDGARRREFSFHAVNGALEAALAEAGAEPSVPHAVTAVLASALSGLGGVAPTRELVRELAVGDRQFLMRQLSAHLGRDPVWLTAVCGACGESFDFQLRQAELPVKEAPDGFPYAEAGRLRLRVPTGADQEAIASVEDDARAARLLFERCRVSGPRKLSEAEIAAAEAALEAASPEVALAAVTRCPSCDTQNEVYIDPYLGVRAQGDELFEEVHRIAATYHWSQAEILGLSRTLRQRYLRLIDRARGVAQ